MNPMPEALFQMEGHFDNPAALRLREQLMDAQAPRAVLDFSHVVVFDDATLALLTVNLVLLRRRGRAVALRGLRDHQLRVLHHFGIDLGRDGLVQVHQEEELPFSD